MKILKSALSVNLTVSLLLLGTIAGAGSRAPRSAGAPPSLSTKIDRILSTAPLDGAKVSMKVILLPGGELLYEKDPDRLLNPASNVKIVTAATALSTLGPDYTFKTEFESEGPIRDGRIKDLWIVGRGDPVFVTEELDNVVSDLKTLGLREITGNLYVDDSYFDHDHLITYMSDLNEKRYQIMTGPLSLNFNSSLTKGRRRWRHGRHTVQIPPGMYDPALFAGSAILDALRQSGIEVGGGLHRQAAPKDLYPIWTHTSPPLREILKGMGKFSNNFIAEQLVKTMGAEQFGPPGSTDAGLRVIQNYLKTIPLPPGSYRLENGSGLAKGNLFSSSQLLTLLKEMSISPSRDIFLSSLSVAGIDGTLKRKWKGSPLKGVVHAKTGSLAGVQALSGYLFEKGKSVAFSFLFNDFAGTPSQVTRAEQKILAAVVEGL